ncbi:MAG: energy transducer TonB [Magnetococcales bacterium]|nr:energy transducer TonB [Magnetococcales bacterium]
MVISTPAPSRFFIALLVALLLHGFFLFLLDVDHLLSKPMVKRSKPMIIEFLNKKPQKKEPPPPEEAEILAEVNQQTPLKPAATEKERITPNLPIQPLPAQKTPPPIKKPQPKRAATKQPQPPAKQSQPPAKPVEPPVKPMKRAQKKEIKKPITPTTPQPSKKEVIPPVQPPQEASPPVLSTLNLDPSLNSMARWDQQRRVKRRAKRREITVDLNTKKIKYASYFGVLKRGIKGNWSYPEKARQRGIKGDLLLSFSIDRQGKLVNITLHRSSGKLILDQAAIQAIRQTAPFPPLPGDWTMDQLNVFVTFNYTMNN